MVIEQSLDTRLRTIPRQQVSKRLKTALDLSPSAFSKIRREIQRLAKDILDPSQTLSDQKDKILTLKQTLKDEYRHLYGDGVKEANARIQCTVNYVKSSVFPRFRTAYLLLHSPPSGGDASNSDKSQTARASASPRSSREPSREPDHFDIKILEEKENNVPSSPAQPRKMASFPLSSISMNTEDMPGSTRGGHMNDTPSPRKASIIRRKSLRPREGGRVQPSTSSWAASTSFLKRDAKENIPASRDAGSSEPAEFDRSASPTPEATDDEAAQPNFYKTRGPLVTLSGPSNSQRVANSEPRAMKTLMTPAPGFKHPQLSAPTSSSYSSGSYGMSMSQSSTLCSTPAGPSNSASNYSCNAPRKASSSRASNSQCVPASSSARCAPSAPGAPMIEDNNDAQEGLADHDFVYLFLESCSPSMGHLHEAFALVDITEEHIRSMSACWTIPQIEAFLRRMLVSTCGAAVSDLDIIFLAHHCANFYQTYDGL